MQNTLRLITTALMLLMLSGCGSLIQQPEPRPPADLSWEQHKARLLALKHWQLSGKIGIRTTSDNHSASLNWEQDNGAYQIDMSGPLGQGGASISGKPGYIHIEIAGEGEYEASSPERLLQDTLGWQFPVQSAHWWIKGLPAPDAPYEQQLKDNRLAQLNQNGWTIKYLRYSAGIEVLPSKLKLARQGIQITLVIKDWKVIQ